MQKTSFKPKRTKGHNDATTLITKRWDFQDFTANSVTGSVAERISRLNGVRTGPAILFGLEAIGGGFFPVERREPPTGTGGFLRPTTAHTAFKK